MCAKPEGRSGCVREAPDSQRVSDGAWLLLPGGIAARQVAGDWLIIGRWEETCLKGAEPVVKTPQVQLVASAASDSFSMIQVSRLKSKCPCSKSSSTTSSTRKTPTTRRSRSPWVPARASDQWEQVWICWNLMMSLVFVCEGEGKAQTKVLWDSHASSGLWCQQRCRGSTERHPKQRWAREAAGPAGLQPLQRLRFPVSCSDLNVVTLPADRDGFYLFIVRSGWRCDRCCFGETKQWAEAEDQNGLWSICGEGEWGKYRLFSFQNWSVG